MSSNPRIDGTVQRIGSNYQKSDLNAYVYSEVDSSYIRRMVFSWDTSSIYNNKANAVIQKVEFRCYVDTASNEASEFRSIITDPVPTEPDKTWAQISDGKTYTLGGTGKLSAPGTQLFELTDAKADLQNLLQQGWFGFAIRFGNDETNNAYRLIAIRAVESGLLPKPTLRVTYV